MQTDLLGLREQSSSSTLLLAVGLAAGAVTPALARTSGT